MVGADMVGATSKLETEIGQKNQNRFLLMVEKGGLQMYLRNGIP